jgi:hypothetical protein
MIFRSPEGGNNMSTSAASNEPATLTADEFEAKATQFVDEVVGKQASEDLSLEYFKSEEARRRALRVSFYETMSRHYVITYPQSTPRP